MTTALTFRGRLPGVAAESSLPAPEQQVRLDVAAFVGFAERGPLDVPVVVEDELSFTTVFGGDLVLAQDGGLPVYAQLPSAVSAFFANGGRRCHIVRIAGPGAQSGRWTIPGLQIWQADGTVAPAVVCSAWPGSWSAGTIVRTTLLSQPLGVAGQYVRVSADAPGVLPLAPGADIGLQPGDLLRLVLPSDTEPGLFVQIGSVDRRTSRVFTTAEGAVDRDGVTPAPAWLAAQPGAIDVATATLLRFDIVVDQHRPDGSRSLDRLSELSFGAGGGLRPWWADTLQRFDDQSPDLTRSMTLRQDAATAELMDTGLVVPVGMTGDPDGSTGVTLAEGNDDLAGFDPAWFADAELSQDTSLSLLAHAEQLASLSRDPRQLRGIHALVGVDEVALIAVPDAIQRPWSLPPTPVSQPVPQPEPIPAIDWSDFRCCSDTPPLPPPEPILPEPTGPTLPQVDPAADYAEQPLIDLQTALITLCAARADAVAVLSVPRHYDVAATLTWCAQITSVGSLADGYGSAASPLSYAAMWHPWLTIDTGFTGARPILRDIPPDGTIAGMIAARELARGAWIAPAGVPLRGPVQLASPSPLTDADRVRLFNSHANLLQQQPGSFTTLSAHTLSGDRALLQVSVRRLLILLRKLCFRLGARYTFEINNDRFRQLVRMRFDQILTALADRGALHAFRVSTEDGLNSADDQLAGRFIVALQIAPTTPVEFITVTLTRSGEGLLDVLEG